MTSRRAKKLKQLSAFAAYKRSNLSAAVSPGGEGGVEEVATEPCTQKRPREGKAEARSRKRNRKHPLEDGRKKKKRKVEAELPTDIASEDEPLVAPKHEDTSQSVRESIATKIADVPFSTLYDPEPFADSREAATQLFKLLIDPFPTDKFFKEVWEKRPMVLQRHKPCYNDGWFSSEELDSILREHHVEFTKNLDLTTYVNGKRKTHNAVGRASAATVWDHFKAGCSVRLLNPQTFSKTIWKLNSTLQELFHSGVGANTYLTPAGSQGFSPHYDDIEAFVLQLEGRKHWKLYRPRSEAETLPQFSSENFTEADIGEPVMEVVLEPGDLLYFPRGYIHQASTPPDTHSLHITMSTYQRNSWADYLEKLLPAALEIAVNEDLEFRAGLPLEYLDYTGIVNSESNDRRRGEFSKKLSHLFAKLLQYAPVNAASDQMGARYVHDCLPPCLTQREESGMVGSCGIRWTKEGLVADKVNVRGDSLVKLFRRDALRLVMEKDATVVYSATQNTRQPHEVDLIGIELQDHEAPGVDFLIHSYPDYVSVDSLPMEGEGCRGKIELCTKMYLQGLLIVKS